MPLLRQVMVIITNNPDVWEQGRWVSIDLKTIGPRPVGPVVPGSCGTTACVAGWAAHLAGWEYIPYQDHFRLTCACLECEDLADTGVHSSGDPYPAFVARKNGEYRSVGCAAQRELGLTYNEAEDLFDGTNTWRNVLDAVNTISHRADDSLIPV